MQEPIIKITALSKRYGELKAVDNLDLTIDKGEVFGLLGPNGAGKSTTILMLLGLTEPSQGNVRVCGFDPTSRPLEVKKRVGYLPDDVGFYDDRSGLENLLFTAQLNRIPKADALRRAGQLLDQVGLTADAQKRTGTYSRGMRQRLGLADVLIKNPPVIILDEPTLGIDPQGVREFLDLIVRLSKEQGITVLLSSHHLHQVQQVCDRVGLFVGGRLIADGNIDALSTRLFAMEPFMVEAGVSAADTSATDAGALSQHDIDVLTGLFRDIPDVRSVSYTGELFRIACRQDQTPAVARTVIDHGYLLTLLQKKRYGLDEIYHRYFENGKNYGKTA
ncbi:MAG TPA: ABC transporter ATP-binding protein [Puia sp.]|nr:ABC transporter ATP-binding protein [Puia sp.]